MKKKRGGGIIKKKRIWKKWKNREKNKKSKVGGGGGKGRFRKSCSLYLYRHDNNKCFRSEKTCIKYIQFGLLQTFDFGFSYSISDLDRPFISSTMVRITFKKTIWRLNKKLSSSRSHVINLKLWLTECWMGIDIWTDITKMLLKIYSKIVTVHLQDT